MPRLNELNCAENFRNVGTSGCVLEPGLIAGFIIFVSPTSFTQTQLQDLQDELQMQEWADNAAFRAYPVTGLVGLTDNSGDPVSQTFDYGAQTFIRDNFNNWTAQYRDGGLCKHSALRSLIGDTRYILFWDKNNIFYGFNDNGKLGAFPSSVYVQSWKVPTGSTVAGYNITLNFDPKWINESLGFFQADFDPAVVKPLQDLQLTVNSFNQNTGVANVTPETYCGATNVYTLYPTVFANTGAYVATNSETGAAITVTSASPTSGTINLTLSTADPDYPSDGGVIRLKLVAPSLLAALGMEGYDSLISRLEVTAS